jgi:hypothetical protein
MGSAHTGPTKRCIDCRKTLPVDAFYRVHKGSKIRQSRCKRCDNKRRCHGGPLRRPRQMLCALCYGLPERVIGEQCASCNLPAAKAETA